MDKLKILGDKTVMTNNMCRTFLAFLVAALVTLGISNPTPVSAATDVYTTPVGFVKMAATNNVAGNTFTTFGLPLQRMKADQGLVTNVTANTFTDSTKNWASTNWWDPAALHYVEFLTGAAVGRYFAVQTNTTSTISLSVGAENLQVLGVANGDRYVVRPFWRIVDVFGTVANTSLLSSNVPSKADNVLFFDTTTGTFKTIFPNRDSGSWEIAGVGAVDTMPLLPDEGLFIRRRASTSTNIVLVGEVRTTNLVTVLEAGFNLVCNSFPADTTISNSMLIGGSSGFVGSNVSSRADNVIVWDQASQTWKTAFYNTDNSQWEIAGLGETNNLVLASDKGYLIRNRYSGGKWTRPIPYVP